MLGHIKKYFDISASHVLEKYRKALPRFLFISLCLLGTQNLSVAHAHDHVAIVYEQPKDFIIQVIQSIESDLRKAGYTTSRLNLDTAPADKRRLDSFKLIIAVGSQSTKHLLDSDPQTPILSILMPKHLAVSLETLYPDRNRWSSLLIDQPVERQFNLITTILGKNQRTGILLGPYTDIMLPSLKQSARKTGHTIITEHIDSPDELNPALKRINDQASVLLTLPDPMVFNKNTIRGILLSSYRNRLPIIGFSHAYVKAGAIAAVYSEPEQISQQTTKICLQFLAENSFREKFYYPEDFSIALNYKVARSLGINLESSADIHKKIRQAEK